MVGRPNILVVLSDNQSAGLLGCSGNDEIHTPYLDQLASEGVRFDNCFSVSGLCSPSRASLLTGLLPSQHGVHTWLDDRMMESWPDDWNALAGFGTLPEQLAEVGYRTALIGKYHLGVPDRPQNGFQRWVTFPLGHTVSFWDNEIIDQDRRYTASEHSVDVFTQKAVEFIDDHSRRGGDDPFFLFVPYNGPYGHWPSIEGRARNRHGSDYDHCPMESVPREGLCDAAVERFLHRRAWDGDGVDYSAALKLPNNLEALRNYYSQVSMVDDGMGDLLSALDRNDIADNTIVIFSSDHGFSLGHHGFWGHSNATWPSNGHRIGYNIPLLVRWPGRVRAGQVESQPVGQVDLYATLLEFAGLEPSVDGISGRSFVGLLDGVSSSRGQDYIVMEQEEVRILRTRDWLYVARFPHFPSFPMGNELYNLVDDPDERVNLVDHPAHRSTAAELEAVLTRHFSLYSDEAFDLWRGGRPKSNSSRSQLWVDAWGADWGPVYC